MGKNFRSSASYGKRQEFFAIAKLLKRGNDVYLTLVDDQGIDCVIKVSDKTYYDVQIKARSKDTIDGDVARFAAMIIKNPRPNYIFIFYAERLDKYWVVPSLELVEMASRNKKGKNIGKYHICFSGFRNKKPYAMEKYMKYEDNFKVFDKELI
tara:strand:+ start:488 stop:946 length:459 start_codon:yes stop_codon:yes gene_type:complete